MTEIVNWKSLVGNPYLQKLHPGMLTKSGYVTEQLCRIKGCKHGTDRTIHKVKFDRDYLIQKLIVLVIQPLNPKDLHSFIELMTEAYNKYKQDSNSNE